MLTRDQLMQRARRFLDENTLIVEIATVAPNGVATLADLDATMPAFGGVAIGVGNDVEIVPYLAGNPGTCLVRWIVTPYAAIEVASFGLIIREVAPGISAKDVQARSAVPLRVGPDLKEMT